MWRRGEGEGEERGRGDSREQSRATGYRREKRTPGPPFRGPRAQDLEFRSPSPSPWRWGAERPAGVSLPIAWAEVGVKHQLRQPPGPGGIQCGPQAGQRQGCEAIAGRVEGRAQTPQCRAQTQVLAARGSPVPLSAAKARGAQGTQEEPRGDCHHRLSLTTSSSGEPAAVRKHSVLGGQRPEAKGQAWQRLWAAPGPGEGIIPCPTRCVPRPLRSCGLSVGPRSRSPSVSVC